jgi:Tfp pilus assembly protein PilF
VALDDFNSVIKMQPANANAYFRRAFTYKALKMYHEAAEDMYRARELEPENPNLIINAKKM